MSFPNAKTTFTSVVNGVTKVIASLWNNIHTDVEAVETFIGAIGRTQANSDSITSSLKNYRRGCECEKKDASEFYVRSGEIMISDASGNRGFRVNTSDLTLDFTDIDAGSEAAGVFYYIYAVADSAGTTFDVKISSSSTAPSGATFYRRIGHLFNDPSSNITSVINYPIGGALGKRSYYESGFFSATPGTQYPLYHGLNTTTFIPVVLFSESSDGSTPMIVQFGTTSHTAPDYTPGVNITNIESNSLTVTIGTSGIAEVWDSSGVYDGFKTSGYINVILFPLR